MRHCPPWSAQSRTNDHFSHSAGNKVVLTQTVNLAQQVQAQTAAQAVTQAATNHLNKRISSQQAAAAVAAQLGQLPQVNQVVTKVSTPLSRLFPGNAQMSVAQSSGQQVTVTQTGQVVTQTAGGQVASGVVQLPPGVVQLNNMPIVVRPPPPKEMRNKSVQCKPSEEEDQMDSDRIEEAVTGKSKFLLEENRNEDELSNRLVHVYVAAAVKSLQGSG